MIINRQLAKSVGHPSKDLWGTPWELFDELENEFHFTLDPCASHTTAKCQRYFTPEMDGLKQNWNNEIVFCNPPYSKGNIDKWVRKAFYEKDCVIVMLLPVSTSSKWFHDFVWKKCELRFIKGRLRFEGATDTAPFSSMIAIYR